MYADKSEHKTDGITVNFQNFVEADLLLLMPRLLFQIRVIRVNPRLNIFSPM